MKGIRRWDRRQEKIYKNFFYFKLRWLTVGGLLQGAFSQACAVDRNRESENIILLLSIKALPSASSEWEPIVLSSVQPGWLPHHDPEGLSLHPSLCPILPLPAKIHLLVLLSDFWSASIPWADQGPKGTCRFWAHSPAWVPAHGRLRSCSAWGHCFLPELCCECASLRSVTAMPSSAVCWTGLWSTDWLPSLTSDLPTNSRSCLVVNKPSKTLAAGTRLDLHSWTCLITKWCQVSWTLKWPPCHL